VCAVVTPTPLTMISANPLKYYLNEYICPDPYFKWGSRPSDTALLDQPVIKPEQAPYFIPWQK